MNTNYSPEIFQGINNFPIAKDLLSKHQNQLPDLGDILRYNNVNQICGISLLHQHFEQSPYEKLVEECVGNKLIIEPCEEESETNLTPYLWKVDYNSKSGQWDYYPLEFVRTKDDIGKAINKNNEILENHPRFLRDMSQKLGESGLNEIFGIGILHRDFISLNKDEMLVEMTDEKNRRLTCSPMTLDKLRQEELTQTWWSFASTQNPETLSQCIMHCNGHRHCHGHQ